jgi:DNA ligase (NAD+)
VVEGSNVNEFQKQLFEAADLGFEIVPNVLLSEVKKDNNLHDDNLAIDACLHLIFYIADNNKLPQDGVVFKFDDVEYGKSLGNTSHHFRNGIAYKVFNDSVETTLRDIEWSCGKTGILTPVAIFDTVDIDGSEVSRASLHNISVMNEILGRSWKGQKIGVYKANMIIPAIRWAEQFDSSKFDDLILDVSYINIPDKCPICGQLTKIVKDNNSEVLACTNDNCKGKLLGKLTHAASKNALNIDSLSKSTIEKFINLGWLTSIKDIYYLKCHENEMKTLEGFGKKSVEKLLSSIEKSRNTTLDRFIYSLSIPMIGKTVSKLIAEKVNYSIREFITTMGTKRAVYFSSLDGISDKKISSIDSYWYKYSNIVYELSKEFNFESPYVILDEIPNTLQGKTFVVTGSVNHYKNRDELKADIVSHGGTVVGSVSSKTSYLINNDINSTSSKNQKAKSLNIPIISEEEFLSMIQ